MIRRSILGLLFIHAWVIAGLGQNITSFSTQNSPLPFNTVRCIEVQNSIVWAGTDAGLAKYENNMWEVFTSSNSPLSSDDIRSLKGEGDSVLWIGTLQGGLFKFDGMNWINYNTSNSGLTDEFVRDIEIDQDNHIWLATTEGVFMFDRINWSHWSMQNNNLLSNNITCIKIGLNNQKYVGTINGGVLYFDADNLFNAFTIVNSGIPDNSILDIDLDPNGQPWFISPAAGLVTDEGVGGPWTYFNSTNSEISTNSLNCLEFLGSQVAIGSEVAGLIFKSGDTWDFLNTGNSSLPDDHILSIKQDDQGNLWLGTFNGGLCKIEFENSLNNPANEFLSVYPSVNQSGGIIYFSENLTGQLCLIDAGGKLLHRETCIDCKNWGLPRHLDPGIYYIALKSSTFTLRKKLLIQ